MESSGPNCAMTTNVNATHPPHKPDTQLIRAVVLDGVNHLEVRDVPVPQPDAGEVVIRVHAAALNHRDVWIKQGQYAGVKFPIIPGSDGAGVVSRLGSGVSPDWSGKEVIIHPGCDWGNDQRSQSSRFSILGLPK